MGPCIHRISRVVSDLARAETFYRNALGFGIVARQRFDSDTTAAFGAGEQVVMRLGAEEIALVRFDRPGRPYPADSRSNDLWFQHLAIVVSDMAAAYAHLTALGGWRAISPQGPQTLPPRTGPVRAFKFRDPDGHPLELLSFPPGAGRPVWRQSPRGGPFLGIDHSALAIASTARSLDFYQALGFEVASRSLNRGPSQARLDDIPDARVLVTGLRLPSDTGPGLELLAYDPPGRPAETAADDIASDWVTLAVAGSSGAVRDPDGHRLLLVDQGIGAPA